jgi:hypothetical protein
MIYEKIEGVSMYKKYSDVIITWKIDDDGYYWLTIRDQFDFKVINTYKVGKGWHTNLFLPSKIVVFDTNKHSMVIDLDTYRYSTVDGPSIPTYFWNDAELWYDSSISKYKVISNNDVLYEFTWGPKVGLKFLPVGIIEFFNKGDVDNYILCRDYKSGNIKWRKEFEWSINRVEEYHELLVIDYWLYERDILNDGESIRLINPCPTTLVIDSKNGSQLWWDKKLGLNSINYRNGAILSGGDYIKEVEIKSGNIMNCIEVKPETRGGYNVYHGNDDGYYYKSYKQHIGKIGKSDGIVEWEYHVQDINDDFISITDWIVLGNNKLVVQVNSNNDEGVLYLIDPMRIAKYSNIKDGERIKNY